MVSNKDCLQLTTDQHLQVPCRKGPWYPESLECPLEECEAQEALEDVQLLGRVVGTIPAVLSGPDNHLVRKQVFHIVCPGTTRDPQWKKRRLSSFRNHQVIQINRT